MAGGDDDIVLGINEGGLKLAHNLLQVFRCISKGRVEEDHINFTVKCTISHEMVVAGVTKRKTLQLELGTKIGEEAMSCCVIFVNICISAEEVWSIWIFGSNLLNMSPKVNKRGQELVHSSKGWEVESCVDRGDCSWYLHED